MNGVSSIIAVLALLGLSCAGTQPVRVERHIVLPGEAAGDRNVRLTEIHEFFAETDAEPERNARALQMFLERRNAAALAIWRDAPESPDCRWANNHGLAEWLAGDRDAAVRWLSRADAACPHNRVIAENLRLALRGSPPPSAAVRVRD